MTSAAQKFSSSQPHLKVGIGGLGAIGMPVAKWLDLGVPGLTLAAISAGNIERAKSRVADFNTPPKIVSISELAGACDIVIECLPPTYFYEIGHSAVNAGRIFIPLSVTSLMLHMDLVDLAKRTGAKIIVPTGALLGLDAVRAAAHGTVRSVVMKTIKPPKSLKKAKFVVDQGIDLDVLTEPLCLFRGSVSEAAALFPANVNVSIALSLAGIGTERTMYEVWADPGVERNCHYISVDADAARFEMSIEGVPTEENPGTGKLTPLSVMATLEGLVSPFKVGT